VPLSEDEQRILQAIEEQFHADDPHLADEMGSHSLYAYCVRQMKWAGVLFGLGVAVLVVALATATSFLVSFGGFVVMLAAALWFERSLRKLGRAGMQRLGDSFKGNGIRDYFGPDRQRTRRSHGVDDPDNPSDN